MYFTHLDSVRFFAVTMVIFSHIFQIWTWESETKALFPLGETGVIIFFVLSGFLITRILLLEPAESSLKGSFAQFYLKRTLRIFPIYYLFLLAAYSINVEDVRHLGIFPWLYITNLYIFTHNDWIGSFSHIWTLAIEEQFYLLWPFLILLLRGHPKKLFPLFLAIPPLTSLLTVVMATNGYSDLQIKVFSLNNINFFALGALLSYGEIFHREKLKAWGYPLLFCGISIYYLSYFFTGDLFFIASGQLAIGVASAGLIIIAIYSKVESNILHNRATIHLGKISYGMYLYHNPLIAHYGEIMAYGGIEVGESLAIKIASSIFLILTLSQLSYSLIEKPILKLKERLSSPVKPKKEPLAPQGGGNPL